MVRRKIALMSLILTAACANSPPPRPDDASALDVGALDAGAQPGDAAPPFEPDAAEPGADAAMPSFTSDERRIGDETAGYFSLEISPDMRFLLWQEIIGRGPQARPGPVWSCGVDPRSGDLVPRDGRGFRVDDIPATAAPQWGQDANGVFFVTVNNSGRLLIVRPSSATTADIETLPTPPNTTRAYPYPTRLTSRVGAYIAFLQRDSMNRPQIHVVDTADPMRVRALTSGMIDMNSGGGVTAPSFVVTVYRWFPETTELTWGFNDPNGRLQVRALDVAPAGAEPRAITDEPHDHIDAFPAILRGERVLVGGIDSTDTGALYESSSGRFVVTRPLQQPSRLEAPMMAASFEPFEWGGRRYASYIVLDGGRKPGDFPAEVWLTDLDDGTPTLLSSSTTLHRMDPEYFLGTNEVFIYFYARAPSTAGYGLYRARTGLAR